MNGHFHEFWGDEADEGLLAIDLLMTAVRRTIFEKLRVKVK